MRKLIFTAVLGLVIFFQFWTFAQATNNAATNVALVTVVEEPRPQLSFGLDQVPALQTKVLGIELWQYTASLIYIFLAFAVARLIDYLVCVQLKKWAEKTSTTLDDILIHIAHSPIKVVAFVIFLHIGLAVFRWPQWIEAWISRGLQLVVAFSVTYMSVKLVDVVITHWKRRAAARGDKALNEQLFPVISKALKTFIVIIAALVTLQNLGLNITGVLASLSIGGLALGLAAQDTVANLFGAVAVFADKPCQIGDFVKLEAIEGTVETIGLRSTRIRNLDGHLITVPNKTMGNATIINVTRRPTIRTIMDIGVTYDTPPGKVKRAVEILNEVYKAHPKTKDLVVAFNQFAASSLNIRVVHWWDGVGYNFKDYMAGMQELNIAVQERFLTEKISFAYPTQTLMLKQDSPWKLDSPAPRGTHAPRPEGGEGVMR